MDEDKQPELPRTQKLQNEYSQVCMQIGDLYFKMQGLKDVQAKIQSHYHQAVIEEQREKEKLAKKEAREQKRNGALVQETNEPNNN